MVGGVIGLMATLYLKPRRNRFNEDSVHQMSSPTNALLGTFMLWFVSKTFADEIQTFFLGGDGSVLMPDRHGA